MVGLSSGCAAVARIQAQGVSPALGETQPAWSQRGSTSSGSFKEKRENKKEKHNNKRKEQPRENVCSQCFACRHFGHVASECPTFARTCFRCGLQGHTRRQCAGPPLGSSTLVESSASQTPWAETMSIETQTERSFLADTHGGFNSSTPCRPTLDGRGSDAPGSRERTVAKRIIEDDTNVDEPHVEHVKNMKNVKEHNTHDEIHQHSINNLSSNPSSVDAVAVAISGRDVIVESVTENIKENTKEHNTQDETHQQSINNLSSNPSSVDAVAVAISGRDVIVESVTENIKENTKEHNTQDETHQHSINNLSSNPSSVDAVAVAISGRDVIVESVTENIKENSDATHRSSNHLSSIPSSMGAASVTTIGRRDGIVVVNNESENINETAKNTAHGCFVVKGISERKRHDAIEDQFIVSNVVFTSSVFLQGSQRVRDLRKLLGHGYTSQEQLESYLCWCIDLTEEFFSTEDADMSEEDLDIMSKETLAIFQYLKESTIKHASHQRALRRMAAYVMARQRPIFKLDAFDSLITEPSRRTLDALLAPWPLGARDEGE